MKPIAGMHRENSFINQPENTYRSALNMVLESPDGDRGSLNVETGNQGCYTLELGYRQIGSILINDDTQVIFSTNETTSKIGLVKGCTYTEIVSSDCLGFSKSYPIKGVFRVKRNDRFIYWVDGVNPDRALDIDNLDNYYTSAYASYLSGGGDSNTYLLEKYDCELIRLDAIFTIPNIDAIEINNTGGVLPVGNYAIALRYVDASENSTNFARVSRAFDIFNEPTSSDYDFIDGAYNLEAGSLNGAVPATSKSVTFDFSNLDASFDFLEIAAIYTVNGDRTSAAYLVDKVAINGDTLQWTFSGFNNGTTVISIDEIAIDTVAYEASKSIDIVSDRLVRGNVTTPEVDWKEFQSLITANAVVEYHIEPDPFGNNVKSGTYKFEKQTHMRDEIYALGVVFHTKWGTKSPGLHLPGRAEITDSGIVALYNAATHPRSTITGTPSMDKQLLTVVNSGATTDEVNLDEVRHLGITTAGGTIENWKVYNTAVPLAASAYSQRRGYMGYYEGTSDYPDIRDASDTPIYPHTDLGGGNYQMHKIRHHRMPDTTLEQLWAGTPTLTDRATTLGITVLDIDQCIPAEYADDIVGYEIVRVQRDEFNKTVVDKGVVQGVYIDPVDNFGYMSCPYNFERFSASVGRNNNDEGIIGLYSPRISFNGAVNFDHIKVEDIMNGDVTYYGSPPLTTTDPESGEWISNTTLFGGTQPSVINVDVDDSVDINKFVDQNNQVSISDGTASSIILNYGTMNGMLSRVDHSDVATELVNTIVLTDTAHDTTASPPNAKYAYVAMKRSISPYNSLNNLVYVTMHNSAFDTSTDVAQVFGGDCFISWFGFKKNSDTITQDEATRTRFDEASFIEFQVESEINCGLRHGYSEDDTVNISGTDYPIVRGQYYRKNFANDITEYLQQNISINNPFLYNPDFSWEQDIQTYTASDLSIDFDSQNPNLLVWSEVSFPSDIGDGFKITKANNFKYIPATQGAIVDIAYYRNRLYVFTDLSVYQLIPNPQQLQTDASVITVGTGEFLGVPEVELVESDSGYAGCVGRFVLQKTEYGLFFVSRDRVYKLLDGIEDISNKGMNAWFDANLESAFLEKYNSQNSTPFANYDAVSHEDFIGVQTVYDPLYQRFIVHKRDYTTDIGVPIYSNMAVSGEWTRNSWTLSYDIKTGVWSSFHWYMPRSMSYDRNYMYTSRDANEVFVHKRESTPLLFYNNATEADIQLCVPTQIPTNLHSISWITRTVDGNGIDLTTTFDKGFTYNTKQCTGLLNLAIKQLYQNAVTYNDFDKYITRVDNTYRLGQLRNMLNDPADTIVTLNTPNVTSRYFNEQGYSEPLPPVITALDQYTQSLMKDRYHIIHLIYTENKRMAIDDISFKLSQSFR